MTPEDLLRLAPLSLCHEMRVQDREDAGQGDVCWLDAARTREDQAGNVRSWSRGKCVQSLHVANSEIKFILKNS